MDWLDLLVVEGTAMSLVPLVSLIFLKRSLVFPILLFSSISLHSSEKAFLSLLAILWNSVFRWVNFSFSFLPFASLLFSAICKASSDSHFAFLHFFFLGMVLIPVSCIVSWTSIHSSSGTLSIRPNPWIYLLFPLCNHKGFDYPEWPNGFPYSLQYKSEFCNQQFMIWVTVSSWSCFCLLNRIVHLWL